MQNTKPRPGLLGLGAVMLMGMALLLTGCAGVLDPTDYQVQKGETLNKIASDYNTTVPAIALLNGLTPTDDLQPAAGTSLKIPPPAVPSMPGPNSPDQLYEVLPGDTLDKIVKFYNNSTNNRPDVTFAKLVEANHLTNPHYLRTGQLLLIPGVVVPPLVVCSHYFQSGDTLDSIASYYGVKSQQILDENTLPTVEALKVGDKLQITVPREHPYIKEPKDCPKPEEQLPAQGGGSGGGPGGAQTPSDGEYIVKSGDTLYSIAVRYHTTVANLAKINHISNPRLIHPGQKLQTK